MADNSNKKKEVKNSKSKKSFFKDVKAELKKVTWPTKKQVVNSTTGVIVIVAITAIIVFVLDFAFKNFNEYVINGVKTQISEMTEDESQLNTITDSDSLNTVDSDAVPTDDSSSVEPEISEDSVDEDSTQDGSDSSVDE